MWNTVRRKGLRWITMRILFLWRWEWTIVTYDLSHRRSEAVFIQIAGGQPSFCVWPAVQTKSTRLSSHLVLLMLGDRRFFRQFGGRRNFRWHWAFVETFFVLVFMSKMRVKARLTSLHCSQGYRFSLEPNVKFVILRAFNLGMFFDFSCFVEP